MLVVAFLKLDCLFYLLISYLILVISYLAKEKYIETEPANLNTGISIQSMSKKFKERTVVNNLTLNFFEGQITALLGHNGAGKSTTMYKVLLKLFNIYLTKKRRFTLQTNIIIDPEICLFFYIFKTT